MIWIADNSRADWETATRNWLKICRTERSDYRAFSVHLWDTYKHFCRLTGITAEVRRTNWSLTGSWGKRISIPVEPIALHVWNAGAFKARRTRAVFAHRVETKAISAGKLPSWSWLLLILRIVYSFQSIRTSASKKKLLAHRMNRSEKPN